jgi:hypothetical protein
LFSSANVKVDEINEGEVGGHVTLKGDMRDDFSKKNRREKTTWGA